MKRMLFCLLCLLLLNTVRSQSYDTTTFYGKMNYVFQNVDKSAISTGLLWDYGIEFAKLDNFTGASLHDSNWVSLTDWRMLYASLFSQQVSSSPNMYNLSSINSTFNVSFWRKIPRLQAKTLVQKFGVKNGNHVKKSFKNGFSLEQTHRLLADGS